VRRVDAIDRGDSRGLEGVVAKHRASIYRSGRTTSWIKVKCAAWREADRERGKLFGQIL
jgi:ATP-dependent DNA ligase